MTSVTIELDDEMLARVNECVGDGESVADVILDLMWIGVLVHRIRPSPRDAITAKAQP